MRHSTALIPHTHTHTHTHTHHTHPPLFPRVEVFKSFRPGDIIRAVVLSLGDAKSYYLSTAKINLGVVTAKSEAGAKLVPISWEEMQCELTQGKEHRKVAKPGGVGSIQVSDGRRLMET